MPLFSCRVLTPQGQIMHSRVEDSSRLACIRRLRKNGLMPISVIPLVKLSSKRSDKKVKKARNIKPTANFAAKRGKKQKENKVEF